MHYQLFFVNTTWAKSSHKTLPTSHPMDRSLLLIFYHFCVCRPFFWFSPLLPPRPLSLTAALLLTPVAAAARCVQGARRAQKRDQAISKRLAALRGGGALEAAPGRRGRRAALACCRFSKVLPATDAM